MVMAEVDIPLVCLVDGVHGRSFAGTGVIVHQGERVGLVLLDRNTVAVGPCDIVLSFGAHPSEVSATSRLGQTPATSCPSLPPQSPYDVPH